MSLQQLFLALRARFGVFATILGITVLVAAIVSMMLPKAYRATASLLVDAKNQQSMSSVQGPGILPQERLGYLRTQMDILTSKRVARKVVQNLKLAQLPAVQEAFAKQTTGSESIEDWLTDGILQKLKVETTQSNVIQVTYTSADPQGAAAIANEFTKGYLETMLELRVAPEREAAQWFDEQLKSLRTNVETAQVALTDYVKKHSIISDDENVALDGRRLESLSEAAARAREQGSQLNARAARARELLAQGEVVGVPADGQDSTIIQKLRSDLLQGEARFRELSSQYGPAYPAYQRQQAENETLRQRLAAETRRMVGGIEDSARNSRQREAELAGSLAGQRARILSLKEDRNELVFLRHRVESGMQAYDTAMQRYVVSQVESRANQTNASVLSAAIAPSRPYRPNILLNVLVAAVVGTILALGIVTGMELLDGRVRTFHELDLEAPVLVELNTWSHSDARRLNGPGGQALALPGPA